MVPALVLALTLSTPDVIPLRALRPPAEKRSEDPPAVRRETVHYELRIDGGAEQAEEIARILEGAWPYFRDFFSAEPRLGKNGRLALELYPSREAWEHGVLADGIGQPAGADRSWFSNKTRKVYAYRNPIDYVTRAHVIYGACLQFHALAKSKNLDLDRDWYVHGIAEMFSAHTWHEGKLELAVDRRVCTIDLPGLALEQVKGRLRPWSKERIALPSVRWAAIRFAHERYPARLEKLALGGTGSKMSGDDFQRSLGPEGQIEKEFYEWLVDAQAPFEVLSWSFEELSDGRIVAHPAPNELASCRLKQPARTFEALIPVGPDQRGSGALVLGWKPPFELQLARFTGAKVFVEEYGEGKLVQSEAMPMPSAAAGPVRARVVRDGELVRIFAGDAILHEMPIAEPVFGLAALGQEVIFENVAWE